MKYRLYEITICFGVMILANLHFSCSGPKNSEEINRLKEIDRILCGEKGTAHVEYSSDGENGETIMCRTPDNSGSGFVFTRDNDSKPGNYKIAYQQEGGLHGHVVKLRNGRMISAVGYRGKKLDGYLVLFSEGSIHLSHYVDGEMSGVAFGWQSDGYVTARSYRNKLYDGWNISIYGEGTLGEWGKYSEGKKDGLWVEWRKKGSWSEAELKKPNIRNEKIFTMRFGDYRKGSRVGIWRELGRDGGITEYPFGEREGK